MRILLTGASSFTGYWFAKALSEAGHQLVLPLRGETYEEQPRAARVAQLPRFGEVVRNCPFGSVLFLDLLKQVKPCLLCHHAAEVKDYRSAAFDVAAAVASNALNIAAVLEAVPAVVLTGTVFEANEGTGEAPLRAFSPYGLSKGKTADLFRTWTERLGIPLGKFVIPNPFGPFEEARFVAYLMRTFLRGETAVIGTPRYVRDNIHVDLLAGCYERFCAEVVANARPFARSSPSGYAETQEAFAHRVSREMSRRLSLPCELRSTHQLDLSEPLKRVNLDEATQLVPAWSEERAWDALASYYENQ